MPQRQISSARYVGKFGVMFKTVDKRSYVHPYGEKFTDAVGEVYISRRDRGAMPFSNSRSSARVARKVSPIMPEGGHLYPLKVSAQRETPEGTEITARVDYLHQEFLRNSNHSAGVPDFEDQELKIILFPDGFIS